MDWASEPDLAVVGAEHCNADADVEHCNADADVEHCNADAEAEEVSGSYIHRDYIDTRNNNHLMCKIRFREVLIQSQ